MANEHPKLINDELPTLWDLFSPLYYFAKGVYQGVQESKAKASQYIKESEQEFERKRIVDLQYASAFQDYYQKFQESTSQKSTEKPKISKPRTPRRKAKIDLKVYDYPKPEITAYTSVFNTFKVND